MTPDTGVTITRRDPGNRWTSAPLVFERSPPRFNERIGERDVGHSEKPSQKSRIDQFVDGFVEVLDSAVDKHVGLASSQVFRGAEQNLGRGVRVERSAHLPGKYPT